MKLLKPGDPCPCCGKPIKTRDPERLELINLYARAVVQFKAKDGDRDGTGAARNDAATQGAV